MAKLYLIRHGETDWNDQKRFQGSIDIPLNDKGRMQAREAAKKLTQIPFAAVYASPLMRAKETAELLMGDLPLTITIEKDLREGSFGSLEGQSYTDIQPWHDIRHLSHEERLHHKWVEDQESAHEVIERVLPCLKKIALAHQGTDVLIVTHGGVMRTLLAVVEHQDWNSIMIHNTQILTFEWTVEKTFRLQQVEIFQKGSSQDVQ